jgi:hypothetical protein
VCWLGGGRCRGSGRFGLVGGGVSLWCCVLLPGIDVVVARKICHNMQLTGVARGSDGPSPELYCNVFRSCACAAEEKKCDLHAGTRDFGMGIGLVSWSFCAAVTS